MTASGVVDDAAELAAEGTADGRVGQLSRSQCQPGARGRDAIARERAVESVAAQPRCEAIAGAGSLRGVPGHGGLADEIGAPAVGDEVGAAGVGDEVGGHVHRSDSLFLRSGWNGRRPEPRTGWCRRRRRR